MHTTHGLQDETPMASQAARKRPPEGAPESSQKQAKLLEITNLVDCDAETDEEEYVSYVPPLRRCVGCGLVWDGSAQCMGGEERCGETVEVESDP